ncbi:MAG: class I tRNA ligase family protein [Lachnospiraceae bacterium]|nr:class I tRNA ligase family protein [Lachnospiraceae bacterium]
MIIMLSPMNHREIEYTTRKFWEENQIEEKNFSDLFHEWENATEREAAISLMNWLEQVYKEVVQEDLLLDYGADCLRLYLMFEKTPKPDDTWLDTWEECNLEGCYKFLGRFRRMVLVADYMNGLGRFQCLDVTRMKKRVCLLQKEVMQHFAKGNTMPNRHNAISAIMEGINELQKEMRIGEFVTKMHSHEIAMAVPHAQKQEEIKITVQEQTKNLEIEEVMRNLLLLVAPFAPVLAEHLWQRIQGSISSIYNNAWKEYKEEADEIEIPIQVNAKTKKILAISANMRSEEIEERAKHEISQILDGKEYKVIYVPGKIINFILK